MWISKKSNKTLILLSPERAGLIVRPFCAFIAWYLPDWAKYVTFAHRYNNMADNLKTIKIFARGLEFVMPYIVRELTDYNVEPADNPAESDIAIISPGQDTETLPQDAAVLVCPNIVGTGMNGLPMELARRIARGAYYHLGNNAARLSTIHATDVAKAVRLVIGKAGKYTVTDGVDPTFHDFAEALAHRLNHKRILTLNSKWVNWIISPALRIIITKDMTYDGSEFASEFDFHPTPVTEYLRTHVYDDESL